MPGRRIVRRNMKSPRAWRAALQPEALFARADVVAAT